MEQAYCPSCDQFLPDRYVEGSCPHCGQQARGDQCEYCSAILDPLDLRDKRCKLCGDRPTPMETEHFYFRLSTFQQALEKHVDYARENNLWRPNAILLTDRYLKEGLQDRAVSRDLPLGVSVPVSGYENKKIYVWIEAVSGYYSASKKWANEQGKDDSIFWSKDTVAYYVHGKDNIPFHSVIWPAILMGIEVKSLPTLIVSNEYLTLEKQKLSTSKNWAVWVPDILERYHPDSIRYFLTINAPENRDTDFSWREFIYSHNSELLGAYGNLVNRTLKFVEKYYDGNLPKGEINADIQQKTEELYHKVGSLIENTHLKQALEEIFYLIRFANKYFDMQKPWVQINEARSLCDDTIATCVYIIGNLSQLLSPFLPFSSNEIKKVLKLGHQSWSPFDLPQVHIKEVKPLFERIDVQQINEESEKLKKQSLK